MKTCREWIPMQNALRILPLVAIINIFNLVFFDYASAQTIAVDGNSSGRVFEGLGALSAGASSRLLIDYPEQQRKEILDFLFKPRYGASLSHLKVEIGGDTQSTDGIEPSHARTRDEFINPKPDYFNRGYEYWLMSEARRRNPDIFLDILQWGAPGWAGDKLEADLRKQGLDEQKIDAKKFYTQDNADFIAAFIRGAKMYYNLDINYCGIWNERKHDSAWIKLLRNTLDRAGFKNVNIIAADGCCGFEWDIVKDVMKDKELRDAIKVIGAHYPGLKSPDEAKHLPLPLWSSEDGFWNKTQDPWQAARILAKMYNQNYIQGRMTKTIIWSLISSYYGNLPLPYSGLMKANQPWSGFYDVQPAIWVTAHTTQFAEPGWQYIDSACALLPGGGSCVSLRNAKGDFSIIAETIDAKTPQTVTFQMINGLKTKELHAWRTTQSDQFNQLPDVKVSNNTFQFTLEPEAVYSFTTTAGQHKGFVDSIPASNGFPLPYIEDFETTKVGQTPKYLSDQGGVFEIAQREDGQGQCLRQVVPTKTIEWSAMQWPVTLIGSPEWTNYDVRCDVKAGANRTVRLLAHANRFEQNQGTGYALSVDTGGQWNLSLITGGEALASGKISFAPDTWHTLKLRCFGPQITAYSDNTQLAQITSAVHSAGMAGIGAGGWYEADFDNLHIEPVSGTPPKLVNLALGAKITASSVWSNDYNASRASDGLPETRWNAAKGKLAGEWLELDFGRQLRIDTVGIRQFGTRITQYKLQAYTAGEWHDILSKEHKNQMQWFDTFKPAETAKLRFLVESVSGNHEENDTPSIYEIEVYDTSEIK